MVEQSPRDRQERRAQRLERGGRFPSYPLLRCRMVVRVRAVVVAKPRQVRCAVQSMYILQSCLYRSRVYRSRRSNRYRGMFVVL